MRGIVQPFRVGSGGMMPTLYAGDHLLVDTLWYRWHPIRRGEILMYRFPQGERRSFTHRVIGLPGYTLELRDRLVLLNGQPILGIPGARKRAGKGAAHLFLVGCGYQVHALGADGDRGSVKPWECSALSLAPSRGTEPPAEMPKAKIRSISLR